MDEAIKREKKTIDKGMNHLLSMDKKRDKKMDKLEKEHKHRKKK
jgi:hypothetical protein